MIDFAEGKVRSAKRPPAAVLGSNDSRPSARWQVGLFRCRHHARDARIHCHAGRVARQVAASFGVGKGFSMLPGSAPNNPRWVKYPKLEKGPSCLQLNYSRIPDLKGFSSNWDTAPKQVPTGTERLDVIGYSVDQLGDLRRLTYIKASHYLDPRYNYFDIIDEAQALAKDLSNSTSRTRRKTKTWRALGRTSQSGARHAASAAAYLSATWLRQHLRAEMPRPYTSQPLPKRSSLVSTEVCNEHGRFRLHIQEGERGPEVVGRHAAP